MAYKEKENIGRPKPIDIPVVMIPVKTSGVPGQIVKTQTRVMLSIETPELGSIPTIFEITLNGKYDRQELNKMLSAKGSVLAKWLNENVTNVSRIPPAYNPAPVEIMGKNKGVLAVTESLDAGYLPRIVSLSYTKP